MRLQKVANSGAVNTPLPAAGDILSLHTADPAGHTQVVASTNYTSPGNGSITVIEQNASVTGWDTDQVVNWRVLTPSGWGYNVIGWLHNPTHAAGGSSWPNQLDAVYTAQDGSGILSHSYQINGTWATEQAGAVGGSSPQGTIVGSPAMVVGGATAGRIDVFVRDEYDQLWHGWDSSGTWLWENITTLRGGRIGSNPTVMSWTPGNLEVFAAAQGSTQAWYGRVNHWWQNLENGGSSAFGLEQFTSAQPVFGSPVAQAWPTSNGFHTFWQGTDHNLWSVYWTYGAQEAIASNAATVYSDPSPILNTNASSEYVAYSDQSNNLRMISCCGWSSQSGALASGVDLSPTSFSWGPAGGGSVNLFYEQSTSYALNSVWCSCTSGNSTGPWNGFGGGGVLRSQPAAVVWNSNGSADVFAGGSDGHLYDFNCCSRNGGNWTWTQVTNSRY
jgi:hypothetical protein